MSPVGFLGGGNTAVGVTGGGIGGNVIDPNFTTNRIL